MRETFAFRISPETARDENIRETRPLLSLILTTALQTSIGYLPQTRARLTGQGDVRLLVGGPSDSVMLNAVEPFNKAFDVSPASAASQFFWVQRLWHNRGFITDFEGKGAGIRDEEPEKRPVGQKWQPESVTGRSLSGCQ